MFASRASPPDATGCWYRSSSTAWPGMGVLDTGAQLSTISMRMAERLGLEEEELAADGTVMAHGAAPDQVAVRLHRFRELRVGPTVVHWPTLPVVPMSDGMGDALVGADFLQGRRVWLSFATSDSVCHADRADSGDRQGAVGRRLVVNAVPDPSPRRPWAAQTSWCGALATRRKPAC